MCEPVEISYQTIVICEGKEDRAFFDAIMLYLDKREYHGFVIGEGTGSYGIDSLPTFLKYLYGVRNFRRKIRDIILLADADANARATFDRIVSHVKNANGDADVNSYYDVPTKEFEKSRGNPTFTVFLQPGPGGIGCLETLLLTYARRVYAGEMGCVDGLIQCSGISNVPKSWSASKQDKSRLNALIAILHKESPSLSISHLWKRAPGLFPIDQPEFSAVTEFFANLLT
jgi:5S rRNA maturation endonuclease (ribonuclease M5)